MKILRVSGQLLLALGMLVLANGVVAFFTRYNFVTQERYGPSLVPVYIIGAAIAVLVVGMLVKTIADTLSPKK